MMMMSGFMAVGRSFLRSDLFLILLTVTTSYLVGDTLNGFGGNNCNNWSHSGGNANGITLKSRHVYFWKYVRHIVSVPRGKGYFASRVNYYSNSDCSFHLIRLITSGDVNVNLGPEKCTVCLKSIARNHRALSCDHCDSRCHIKCGRVTPRQYTSLKQMDIFNWICPPFSLSGLPFFNTTLNSSISSSIDSSMASTESQGEEISSFKTSKIRRLILL